LREALKNRVLILDGAYGTEFMKRGYTDDTPGDILNLEAPEMVFALQREYVKAGADIILTNTFNANVIKMKRFSLGEDTVEGIIREGVRIAREAAKGEAYILGDIGPTGEFLPPVGKASYGELYEAFLHQARIMVDSGVDGIILETFSDILELKMAVRAVRDVSEDIFLIAHLTFDESGRTLTGSDPLVFATVMQDLKVDALGINCQLVPQKMLPIFEELARNTDKMLVVEPEAGRKGLEISPEEFAQSAEDFWEAGANIIGACCGSTPDHIRFLKERLGDRAPVERASFSPQALAGAMDVAFLSPFLVVGENMNPAGRKKLRKAIEEKDIDYVLDVLRKQMDAGVKVVDVNFGVEQLVDPDFAKTVVLKASYELGAVLSLDVQSPGMLEELMKVYPGRPLVNSSTVAREELEAKAGIVKRYGGMLVLLAMEKDVEEEPFRRLEKAKKGMKILESIGLDKDRVFIDPLVLSKGAGKDPMDTLETIRLLKAEGYKTIAGISNVSFGLPHRKEHNACFLTMAIAYGLDAAIVNPLSDKTREALKFSLFLLKDMPFEERSDEEIGDELVEAMIRGEEQRVVDHVGKMLEEIPPLELIDRVLKPAMEKVGKLYEEKKIYLPHLLLAAQTAKRAFDVPLKYLEQSEDAGRTFIICTVKGDIHDIGKGIVAAVVKASGFRVKDLGVDVPSERIVEEVEREKPLALGLSAMMTTTVGRILEVAEMLRSKNIHLPILVGGASVDERIAKQANAYYCRNATEAVKTLEKLLNLNITNT